MRNFFYPYGGCELSRYPVKLYHLDRRFSYLWDKRQDSTQDKRDYGDNEKGSIQGPEK